MKKGQIWLKNFAAGRKALLRNILLYGGSALAVHQIVSSIINQQTIYDMMMQNPFCAAYVYPVLDNVLFYLCLAVIFSVFMQSSFTTYSSSIKGSDVAISLKIGDIFKCDGDIIVPCNNLFTNHPGIINSGSIQQQLADRAVSKEFKGSQPLDEQIDAALASDSFRASTLSIGRQSLMGEQYNIYPFGTLLPVHLKKGRRQKTFYLVAMSKFISEGKPTVSHKELITSIDNMWFNIRRDRIEGDTLVIPVLGTGAAKLTSKPMHIIAKYILRSFAANASELGIKKLVLCIYPGDYLEDRVDMDELRTYVDYLCRFPESDFVAEEN